MPSVQVQLSMPAHQVMTMFQAREVEYILKRSHEDDRPDASVGSSSTSSVRHDAFTVLREASRRAFTNEASTAGLAPLPPPTYTAIDNAKIQLEVDVHEILDSLGMQSPISQHSTLKKLLKTVVNYCWYVDPHHARMSRLGCRLPNEFAHLSETTYNKYKDKKQKTPRLKYEELESHVNELYVDLTTPALKLPCNVRVSSVLAELANSAAELLSTLKAHAAKQSRYRETIVVNEGNIVMSFHKKLMGPFANEIEKALVRELRAKVAGPQPS